MYLGGYHPAVKFLLRFFDKKRGYLPREIVLQQFVLQLTPEAVAAAMRQVPAEYHSAIRGYVLAQFPGIEDPSYSILMSNGWHGPDDPFIVGLRDNLRALRDHFASADMPASAGTA